MKTFQFILVLVLISIFITQEADTCSSSFKEKLIAKCNIFEEQYCSSDDLGCFRRGCEHAKDKTSCEKSLPGGTANLHKRMCVWNDSEKKCKEEDKTCANYNIFGGVHKSDGGDDCSQLKSDDPDHEICTLKSKDNCDSLPKDCSDIDYNYCYNDVVVAADFSIICKQNSGVTPPRCERDTASQRACTWINNKSGYQPSSDFNICPKFKPTVTGQNCIHFKNKCIEAKLRCQDYDENTCKYFQHAGITNPNYHNHYNMPLNSEGNEFDYSRKCIWNNNQCIDSDINCSDYDRDKTMCENLKFKGTNIQKCFHETDDDDHQQCIEIKVKYDDCSSYNNKETDKDREKCINSLLPSLNKKCEYNLYRDECKAEGTYSKCSDYNNIQGEKDRIICESIKTDNHPFYCVLDKDDQCVERELNCEEVYDEEECLHIAKARDPNKICAYDRYATPKCYEEFRRCEDFIGTSNDPVSLRSQCEGIKLYNGLICEYDSQSNKCRSILKVCNQANSKEECKLIAKTGVSNPERKVCDYVGGCKEIFKYCSDYRGTNEDDCREIKPYLSNIEKIDELSRCEFEAGKCQKVPKYCSDADDNPILCNTISPFIKDNSTKYCRYDKSINKCLTDYKTCNDYKETNYAEYILLNPEDPSHSDEYTYEHRVFEDKKKNCEKIIPKDYEIGSCEYKLDTSDNMYKCLPTDCSKLNKGDEKYRELCNKLLPNCNYDSNSNTCEMIERSCEKIRFYSESEGSEDVCNKIGASEPYKICTLKEDKSGCKEIFRELSFSTAASSYKEPPGTQSQESSEMVKGIHLIIILLFLLF